MSRKDSDLLKWKESEHLTNLATHEKAIGEDCIFAG
jgi:hypothetical protein